MKSVLASFKPKYCELIASGQKTGELRKSCPKIEVPFRVYMYQTKERWIYKILEWLGLYQGKVIGEFVCDEIYQYTTANNKSGVNISDEDIQQMSCLTKREIANYEYESSLTLYGVFAWHISNLVIYDKPKELSEFRQCHRCEYYFHCKQGEYSCNGMYKLQRPPQSWCYVEELEQSSGEQ